MTRRYSLFMLAGALFALPLAVHAQAPATPVIGWLNSQSFDPIYRIMLAAFHRGLNETGFVEGQNVAIEYRWAENDFDRLPALASDLVRRNVAVIVGGGGQAPAQAAKAASTTIPIVSIFGGDPVKSGLVASLNRPGGNITGATAFARPLNAKRLELLRETVPSLTSVAALVNPNNVGTEEDIQVLREAAGTLGLHLTIVSARTEREIDDAFALAVAGRNGAILVVTDPFFGRQSTQIAALAVRHGIPAVGPGRPYVEAGGLMGYASSVADLYRKLGVLAGRILKGEKPSDLPIEQPTRFELVVNLKTAKALGITIPQSILVRADEVIE